MIFKSKIDRLPPFQYYKVPRLEYVQRLTQLIEHPDHFRRSLKVIVEVEVRGMFGRSVRTEYYDAGFVDGFDMIQTMTTAKTRYKFKLMKVMGKGVVKALHIFVGDWYVGRKSVHYPTQRGDFFYPSWTAGA